MEREDAILLARGAGCGVAAGGTVLVVTWLLVVGPSLAGSFSTVVQIVFAAHQPLSSGPITEIGPVTWFELPATVLHVVAPLALASAGVVAGRLTRETALRIGLSAGLSVALGYVPLLAIVSLRFEAAVGPVVAGALVLAVVCGALGGVVGVRT